jgi:hypothetical protein
MSYKKEAKRFKIRFSELPFNKKMDDKIKKTYFFENKNIRPFNG